VRILTLTDRLSLRGGAGHHLLDVLRGLAHRAELTVAAGQWPDDLGLPAGIATTRIQALGTSGPDDRGLERLDELLEQADVVHVQNVMNPTAMSRAVETGKTIVTVQDHRVFCPGPGRTLPSGDACTQPMSDEQCTGCLPDPDYRKRLLAWTQARLDALHGARVLVLSEYMADELQAAGLPRPTVLPPPVRAATLPSAAGNGFLLAGRLVHHKAVDLAAEAWRRSGVRGTLKVAGAGALAAELTDTEHLGWLDRSTLQQTLAEARALLFPSRWQEPFGILGLEALAVGTPVIAMVRGGMTDWADTGTCQVPPGDVDAMAAAIQQLDADPDEAQRLGHAGWEMVRSRYTPDRLMDRLWAIYESAA